MKIIPRWKLRSMFREYFNDYLTIDNYASVYGVSNNKMYRAINIGRILHNKKAEQLQEARQS